MRDHAIIFMTVVIITLAPSLAASQNVTTDSAITKDILGSLNGVDIHTNLAANPPEFPGGKKAWHEFLRSNFNIRVPIENKAPIGTYQVRIRFIVGINGQTRSPYSETDQGYGLEAK